LKLTETQPGPEKKVCIKRASSITESVITKFYCMM